MDNVMIVLGGPRRHSAIHIHVSIIAQTPPLSSLLHNIDQSSLYCTVGKMQLFLMIPKVKSVDQIIGKLVRYSGLFDS